MATRPLVRAPKFGRWLELQRRGRTFEQVAIQLRPMVEASGLKVDRSTVKKMEAGQVPSWPLLLGLSAVYGVPVEETLRELVSALEFSGARDLLRHTSAVSPTPNLGGVGDATATRIRELEGRLEERDARIRDAEDVATRLLRILAADPEGGATGKPKRPRGSGSRKAS